MRRGDTAAARLDDATALDGPTVDVAVRIGWVLRMARQLGTEWACEQDDVRPIVLDRMAAAIGSNTTKLHRVETGARRSGLIADGYEQMLGLPDGALRAPIDVSCRYFANAPTDRDPGAPVESVQEMSALTDAVGGSGPTGGDWLRWARALSQTGSISLPEGSALMLVRRLVNELARATSHGYAARYEALALLRCSAYGHLVLEVAREVAGDLRTQVMYDLMSAVGEAVSSDGAEWALGLLDSPRARCVIGGALVLEGMGQVSAAETFWPALVEPLLAKFEASEQGSAAYDQVSHLLRLVPRAILAGRRPGRPLAPLPAVPDWSRSRRNAHWSECQDRAHEICRDLGLTEQPLLTRMLFEMAVGPHATRAITSYMLLRSVPRLAAPVGMQLAGIAADHADPAVRARAGGRIGGLLNGHDAVIGDAWLADGDPFLRERAMMMAGSSGRILDSRLISARPDHGALYAAGMASHPVLKEIAVDPGVDAHVRGAAQWWLETGGRIVD